MTFDPVLCILIYLFVGTLIWMVIYCLGGFAGVPQKMVVAESIILIVAWLLIAYALAVGHFRLRRIYRAEARR